MTDSLGLLALAALALCLLLCGCNTPAALADDYAGGAVTLDANALYGGFDARRVQSADGAVTLDARALKLPLKGAPGDGWIVTDPIDLRPRTGGVATGAAVESLAVAVDATVPETASAEVAVRSSANGLSDAGWSDWQSVSGLSGSTDKLAGPFVQVRVALKAKSADALPAVRSVTVTPGLAGAAAPGGKVAVTEANIQQIVRSPIEFHYERPDQETLLWLRKVGKLDEVVAGKAGDFEKLVALMDWAGGINNIRGDSKRHREKGGYYCWDMQKVIEVTDDGKLNVHGHCMSYAEVLASAATAMGYPSARHMAMVGFREASHEVVDVWVPDMGKWVYLDPSLTQYYMDKQTKTPLNLIEMHKVVADTFVPEGKDMHWWMNRGSEETRARVKKIGGKTPIAQRLGPWRYGEPMPRDYDWGWKHGYLAAGFVQMTPRNDYHSNPQANPRRFEHLPGYAGYPNWVDAKTPPKRGAANWFTRMRDFYWTLDQATVALTRTGGDTVTALLGQSMPHFDHYRVTTDAGQQKVASDTFAWKLKPGENTLTVAPVDKLGKVGLASKVTVKFENR